MCGIVGYLGDFTKDSGCEVLTKMNDEIIHRGPDDFGMYCEDNIAFGMRRLSIVDLSGGHQPIFSDDHKYAIVFNGEIYNHNEIRDELVQQGISFNTRSDTEVILKLYIYYGMDFIHKLNGMFSFFILDRTKNKAYLFRDRIGIKPMYYYLNDDNKTFLFASEIKSIIASQLYKKDLRYDSISDYLTLRHTSNKDTIWSGIKKLSPGNFIEYDLGSKTTKIDCYWDFKFQNKVVKNDAEYIQEFSDLIQDAVKKRIVSSDVPVGVFLSGGLDSSIISSTAVNLGHTNFHTFSVGFEDDRDENELSYAREMAKHIDSKHHEVIVSKKDFLEFLPDLVYYTDEPYADLTSVPLYFLSKKAAENVKVVLSGEGADELFGGYDLNILNNRFSLLKKIEKYKSLFFMLKPFIKKEYRGILEDIQKYGVNSLLEKKSVYMTKYWTKAEKEELLKRDVNDTNYLISSLYGYTSSNDVIDKVSDAYCRMWLVEDLLMKADKMTMANSLEARVPFLDHRIIEFASTLPTHLKVTKDTTKYILREYAKDIIPESILQRPKKGFSIPVYKWLQDDLNGWAKELINDSEQLRIFDKSMILKEFDNIKSNNQSAHKIWIMIILHYWLKKWL